jgi:dTMP kinase
MNRLFVCFVGIDGSGKTTHAKHLANFLDERNHEVTFVWSGYKPFISYTFFGLTRLLGYWRESKDDAFTDPLELSQRRIHDKLGAIFRLLMFLDFQIRILVKIRLPLLFGKTVVCDRYAYDSIVDLVLSNLYSQRFGRILIRSIPKPQAIFLMDVSEEMVSMRREFESKQFLREKKKTYLKLARNLGFSIMDTSKDFAKNQRAIRQKVLQEISAG